MSDSLDVTPGSDLSDASDPPFNAFQHSETFREREGLPRSYRMRADRHYVDQIGAEGGQPVRLLPLSAVDSSAPEPDGELRPLIESIRSLGIVHPLLVSRHDDRYRVVAGRRRFAVAQVLRLDTVPCIVRDVGPSEAAALATADNLTTGRQRRDEDRDFSVVRQLVADHLHRVMRASDLAVGYPHTALDDSSARLVRAHAWRGAYLFDALDVLEHPPASDAAQTSAIAPVLDEVARAFVAETQLREIELRVDIGGYYTVAVGRRALTVALGGALFATLAALGDARNTTVVIRTVDRGTGSAVVEMSQTHRNVGQPTFDDLMKSDSVLGQHIDGAGAMGALAARTITERCGGTIECVASVGTRITMTFPAARQGDLGRTHA